MRRGPGAIAPGAIGVRAAAGAGTAGSGAVTVGAAWRTIGAAPAGAPGGSAVCPPGPGRAGAAFGVAAGAAFGVAAGAAFGVIGPAFGAGLFGGCPLRKRSRSPAPPGGGEPAGGVPFCWGCNCGSAAGAALGATGGFGAAGGVAA